MGMSTGGADRVARALPALGWVLLALAAGLPLLAEPLPVEFVSPGPWAQAGKLAVLLALLAAVGARAWADGREGACPASWTLGLALLAAGLTAVHWLVVDSDPVRLEGQKGMYLGILNRTVGAPHQYRPLPYGFARLLERLTGNWVFGCVAYRWFFTFWFVWAAFRLARLFLTPALALLTLVPLVALYPLSILFYNGQLTDPLSHALLVLGVAYVVEGRPASLVPALFFGVLAKETAVLLVPAYLACYWRAGWKAWAVTAGLGCVGVASFLAARLPLGWWPGYDSINGTTGLMVGTNLGLGEPIASTGVPRYVLQNYLHPLLFVGSFVPVLAWRWREIDARLRAVCVTLVPLLLASNLCFGWMYESRNYMPAVPLLATMALAPQRRSERHREGA
jgi:hypothetical protein